MTNSPDPIPDLIQRANAERMRADLLHLSKDPLPYRKLNATLPGHAQNTLHEADDFLGAQLGAAGYVVEREGVQVQCFRCDASKPKAQQYSPPHAGDPWYTAYNLYAKKTGTDRPGEILIVCSHKDSQSWCDSPGANDNAIGAVGNLELARALADYESRRSMWFLFCNEEHKPWTSVAAAENAARRGDKIVAVFNLDGIGVKSVADTQAGRKTNVTAYTEPEGKRLADLMAEVNQAYGIGLEQTCAKRENPGDDDGSFVKAGFPAAVVNIGSWPYADPNYHRETDVPELTDLDNAGLAVQATLAALMRLDAAD